MIAGVWLGRRVVFGRAVVITLCGAMICRVMRIMRRGVAVIGRRRRGLSARMIAPRMSVTM